MLGGTVTQAKNCADCVHHCWKGTDLTCQKGHKPRFYHSQLGLAKPQGKVWGWKRRCDDFQACDSVIPINHDTIKA